MESIVGIFSATDASEACFERRDCEDLWPTGISATNGKRFVGINVLPAQEIQAKSSCGCEGLFWSLSLGDPTWRAFGAKEKSPYFTSSTAQLTMRVPFGPTSCA
jgi:hypothetical protein